MAPFTLTVRDETTAGSTLATLDLQLEVEQVTLHPGSTVSFLKLVPLVGG
jgi:hypothetical protein